MTFGLLGDVLFGLAVVLLVGKFLDHRKHRWTGRSKTLPAPPPVFTPAETIPARAALARSRRLHGGGDGFELPPSKTSTVELPLKVKSWR